jgi:predicted enzyme related to lactoylglutathione lyase
MAVTEIAFTAYPAKDVSKLRDWYRDALGLQFSAPFEENGTLKYDEANVGGGYFSVMTTEWSEVTPGSASGVGFEVDDIEQTKRDLEGRGIKVEDVYDTPVCRVTSFRDPEGNKVTLHQSTD